MKMKLKLSVTAILIVCVVTMMQLLFSCNSSADSNNKNNQSANDGNINQNAEDNADTPAGAESEYDYPALDCKGEEFTILNTSTNWGFYTDIVLESMTGEILDDALFNRNRYIEEKFNVKIKEVPFLVDQSAQKLSATVKAGDDLFDAAYIPGYSAVPIGSLVADNLLYNLNQIPELRLDEKWWNQSVLKNSIIGRSKSLFFAFCDINIMPLQCAFCIYINEDMIKNLGLETPYKLVKDGKWTYDEFYKYMKAGAQLNGAETFKWEASGPAIYGYTSFAGGTLALMTASGECGVKVDGDGMPWLAVDNERFYNVCDKLYQILSTKDRGEHLTANDYGSPFHFELIFRNCRALMMGGELKAADSFRDMEDTFGIVPVPKFDEVQDRYYTAVTVQSPMLTIPVTNSDTPRAGIILDAMAYVSNKDITPIFFDVTMSQKRLRTEEAIDMLYIIKDSLMFDIGFAYGWSTNIITPIRDSLDSGKNGNAASTIEKQKEKSQASIDKTMEFID